MKTFRYALGHAHYTTMTVGELIAALQQHPADMPVLATWEGICTPIRGGEYMEVDSEFHGGMVEDQCPTLILNVDCY